MDKTNIGKSPLVSVLMPVYNTAMYLKEAIESILRQSFLDFELIILNDGSTDCSLEIINSFKDNRLVLYNGINNVGVANIMNVGLRMARGKYIARMDSDDISLPNRLQFQVDFLNSHPEIDVCSCAMQQFGDSDRLMKYSNETETIKFNAMFFCPILNASTMCRREVYSELYYEQDKVPAEDYHLWMKALVAGFKMINIPIVMYKYRIFSSQATNNIERVNKATELVRREYIKLIYPDIDEVAINSLLEIPNLQDFYHLKRNLVIWDKWNDKTNFIEPNFFKKQIKRYFQTRLYDYMYNNGIIYSQLLMLRLSQVCKLLMRAIK